MVKNATQKKPEAPKSVTGPTLVPKSDTPAGAEAKPEGAKPEGEKAKRKASDTVVKWRATKAFPHEGVIKMIATNNPKSRGAKDRFALYKDGMTVGQYIEASHKAGNSKALATADVRWDVAAGFISVTVPAK